jgi:hypothetical protein
MWFALSTRRFAPRLCSIRGGGPSLGACPVSLSPCSHNTHTGFRVNPSNGFSFLYHFPLRFRLRFRSPSFFHPAQSRRNRSQYTAIPQTNAASKTNLIVSRKAIRPPYLASSA